MRKIIALCLMMALMATIFSCTTNSYKLTVDDQYEILYDRPAKRYRAGDQVTIKTHILTDIDIECFINGKSIGKQTPVETDEHYTHWEYYFEMPAEDVTVTFKLIGGM